MGYCLPESLVQVAHGRSLGLEGKFSTRSGKTIHLEAVLKEAIKRARKLTAEAGVAKKLSLKEQEKVAQAVGIGAVKYNDLKQNPRTDIIFNWEKMLTLEGNSGPYLQYTVARCFSVLEKSRRRSFENLPKIQLNQEELAIIKLSCHWDEVMVEAAQNFLQIW